METKKKDFNIRSKALQVILFGCKEFGDKNYNMQFLNVTKEQQSSLKAALVDHGDSKYFIQGDSDNWLMVEFWCHDLPAIERACQAMVSVVQLTPNAVMGWRHPEHSRVLGN